MRELKFGLRRWSALVSAALLLGGVGAIPIGMAPAGAVSSVPRGIITAVAGNGAYGNSGDGGAATAAPVGYVVALAVDASGDVFIAQDTGAAGGLVVRRVDHSTGVINRFAGTGAMAPITDGVAATVSSIDPKGLAIAPDGDVYISDQGHHRIRRVDRTTGLITTVAGTGVQGATGDGGPAVDAGLNGPGKLSIDGAGNLFLADSFSGIRRIDAGTGIITTVASYYSGDFSIADFTADASGGLYVGYVRFDSLGDFLGSELRKLAAGTWTPTLLSTDFPIGLSADHAHNLVYGSRSDSLNDNDAVQRLDPAGAEVRVAGFGPGASGYAGDGGYADRARLYNPGTTATDPAGNVWFADQTGSRVRKITFDDVSPTATLTTPAAGATHSLGASVPAGYGCSDPAGGLGLDTCVAPVTNGHAIDTASVGTKSFSVTATDIAGNTATVTHSYSVVDDVPPSIDINHPDGDAMAVGSFRFFFYGCDDGYGTVVSCVSDVASGTQIDTSTAGTITHTVTATDTYGNQSRQTVHWTIDGDAPTVTITFPEDFTEVGTGELKIADYSCADATTSIATCVGSQDSNPIASGSPLDTSTEGTYTFSVVATDVAGNSTYEYRTLYVTDGVDTIAPTIEITNPIDGFEYPEDPLSTFSAFSCDDGTGSGIDFCSGSFLFDRSPPGVHEFTVNARDLAGNTSSRTVTYTVLPQVAPTVVLTPGAGSVLEGSSGSRIMNVPVSLSAPSNATVSADWHTMNNTATAPSDYASASGTVTFAPGQTQATVPVTVKGDAVAEPDETMLVAFSNPANATIGGLGVAVGTIVDDDRPAFSVNDVSVTEGKRGTKNMTFTVKLSARVAQVTTVAFATADGSAHSGSDYLTSAGIVTFKARKTSVKVKIRIVGDTIHEPTETLHLNLSNASTNTRIADASGTGTIVDND